MAFGKESERMLKDHTAVYIWRRHVFYDRPTATATGTEAIPADWNFSSTVFAITINKHPKRATV